MHAEPTAPAVPHADTDWAWKIPLRRRDRSISGFALVDQEDFERFKDERASLTTAGYANLWFPGMGRRGPGVKGAGHYTYLHRAIFDLRPGDPGVDHINGDTLDCRRHNLRRATQAQNCQNKRSYGATSAHRGVCWDKSRQKWIAYVKPPGQKLMNLGRFDDEQEAANVAAKARARLMPFSVDR